jgi:uncharacterized radical SAM superfamily Fe-S cluster-containing enzyme
MTSDFSDSQNRGICPKCNKITPARHEIRGTDVYLIKDCPDCGAIETVVSTDAASYMGKREMMGYGDDSARSCSLDCTNCSAHKAPSIVFIDVTNRCNMNCPFCLANIPAMGFRFDPPMAYFEKIFKRLAQFKDKPKIQLFGGEPTVRKDLIDIIMLAKDKYGLEARVTTNGLRLADEEYCKQLVATGTQFMFSFDGRHPSIYEFTRKSTNAYERKLKGLENLGKFGKSKVTLMYCASSTNEPYLADLVEYCHENRHFISALDMIPLSAEWGPEKVDMESCTIEDVERMAKAAVPGLEFFPAGVIPQLKTLLATFKMGRITFGGAHPNCESVSVLISDGEKYSPPSRFLKTPLDEAIRNLLALDAAMGKKFEGTSLSQGKRRMTYGRELYKFLKKHVNLREVFGGSPLMGVLKIWAGKRSGKKTKELLREHTRLHGILRLIVLPFEEKQCVEAARLVDCPASFAYEHPESKEIRFMPVCAWSMYKDDILRSTAETYGFDDGTGNLGMGLVNNEYDSKDELANET